MEKYLVFLFDLLSESSTMRGAVTLLILVFGRSVTDAQLESVVAVAIAVSAFMKMAIPDALPYFARLKAKWEAAAAVKAAKP